MVNSIYNRGRFRLYVKDLGLETGLLLEDKITITKYSNLDWLILLNKHNSDKVEEEIKNDDNYIPFTKMLINYFIENSATTPKAFPQYDRKAVLAVARMIDIENSTNVWRFNREKMNEMVSYIVIKKNHFWKDLISKDDKKRKQLVKVLASSNPDEEDDDETEGGIKPNSLASKICKYFAQYICGDKKQNLYFINDSFVRSTLPYYYYFYTGKELSKTDVNKYEYGELFDKLDEILEAVNKGKKDEKEIITRGLMDHIMWYCYKNSGNIDRTSEEEAVYYFAEKAALLYGVLPIKTAAEFLNNLNEKYRKDKSFSENSFKRDNLPTNCEIRDVGGIQCLVHTSLNNDVINSLKALSEGQSIWPAKSLEKASLADFGNTNIIKIRAIMLQKYERKNKQTIDVYIKELLQKMLDGSPLDANAFLNDIITLKRDITFLKKEKTELKMIIKDLFKRTRMPRYLGFREID